MEGLPCALAIRHQLVCACTLSPWWRLSFSGSLGEGEGAATLPGSQSPLQAQRPRLALSPPASICCSWSVPPGRGSQAGVPGVPSSDQILSQPQDQITITGYEKNTEAARDAILKIVGELEQMVSEDVPLDHRVHARIIGARGKAIRKIMDEFKVSPQAEPGAWLALRAGGEMGCTPPNHWRPQAQVVRRCGSQWGQLTLRGSEWQAALRPRGEGASAEGAVGARTAGPSPTLALCALRPGGHPLPAERGARPQLRDRDGAPGERGGGHRPHPQPGGGIRESCGGSWPRWAGVTGPCRRLTPPVPTAGRRGRQ